jgi:hypothetical protein
LLKQGKEMMTNRIQMTANNSYLHLTVGAAAPNGRKEEGPLRQKATRFYWDLFQFLKKDPHMLLEAPQARVLRLSFEDDFEEEVFLDEDAEEEDLLPEEDLFEEDDGLFEEGEEPASNNELFYK